MILLSKRVTGKMKVGFSINMLGRKGRRYEMCLGRKDKLCLAG